MLTCNSPPLHACTGLSLQPAVSPSSAAPSPAAVGATGCCSEQADVTESVRSATVQILDFAHTLARNLMKGFETEYSSRAATMNDHIILSTKIKSSTL